MKGCTAGRNRWGQDIADHKHAIHRLSPIRGKYTARSGLPENGEAKMRNCSGCCKLDLALLDDGKYIQVLSLRCEDTPSIEG